MGEDEKIIKIQEEIKGYKEKLYQDKNFVAELEENLTEDTWDYINKFNRYIIENKGGYINYEDDEYNEEEYYNNYVDIEALKLKFLPSKEWIEKNLKSYYSYCVKIIGDFGADVDEIDTKAIEKAGIEKCFKLWKLCICKNKHGWKISDEVAKEHLDECLLISKAMLKFEEIPSIIAEKYPEEYLKMVQKNVKKHSEKLQYVDEIIIEKYPEKYLKMAQDTVKKGAYNLQYVDGRIIDKYSEKYLKMAQIAVEENANDLQYVDGRIIDKYSEEYLKMAQGAVEKNANNFECVDGRIIDKYSEEYLKMAQGAVEKKASNLQYVDGRIIDKYPEEYLKMAQIAVEENANNLQYVGERIIEKYPEEYLKIVQDFVEYNVSNLEYVDERIIDKYPEEYLKMVQETVEESGYNLQYVDGRIIDKYPEEYLKMAQGAVEKNANNFECVDGRIIDKYPEEYLRMAQIAVEENASNFQYVDGRIIDKYPEEYLRMAQIAVEENASNFQYVDGRIIDKYPEEYIKMAQKAIEDYEMNFPYVDGRIIDKYPEEYLKMAQGAVEKNANNFECVDGRIIDKYPEEYLKMAQGVVEYNVSNLEYVDVRIIDKYPKEYLKMTQDVVEYNKYNFVCVDERIIDKYPEEYLKMAQIVVEKNASIFQYVDGRIIDKYPEEYLKMAQIAVEENASNFQYVDGRIIDKYPEEYIKMAQKAIEDYEMNFPYVDERIIEKYPEKYLKMAKEVVERDSGKFPYVDERIIDKYPEEYLRMAQKAVEDYEMNFPYVDERIIDKYPEEYLRMAQKAVEDYEMNFPYVDERIIDKYPEEYLRMAQIDIEENASDFRYVDERIIDKYPEEYLKMVQKCLKTNVNVYKYIDQDVRDSEEIKNMMFENAKAIERIKEKAKFKVNDEIQMDIFYHQMIKSIGLEETEKLVEIPNLSKEEVEKYGLEYDERLNELFDRKYKLKGETGAVIEIFKAVDLREYQEKGKNIQFEVYKNINKILEESDVKNLKMSDVMKISLEKSGIKNADEVVLKMGGKLNTIVENLSEEKLDKTRNEIVALLNDGLVSQQEPVRRIIETKIKESLKEGEGIYNKEEIINKIKEELARTRENGGTYYSPHIINQEEKILQITKDFLESKSVEEKLQKSLTQTLKEQKEKIGKGWIRKVLGVPEELSKEEYENLEKKLGIKLESSYIATVKQGIDEGKAFELLREKSVPGVITYLQIESMFSEMKAPYSEEFRKFYSKNKREILEDPKVYRELSRMHNNFESIVNDPYVKKKYERGELSLENYMQILNDRKYGNVKLGNERFADVAARAGLGKEKFEHVQEIWEKTKKREGTTIPQVKASNKKYKGRILRADEPLNLFVGNVTTCCQKSGDVGEGSMQHGSTERNGAIFVIEETGTNAVVGQSWVWRNNGRICFDNIEINNDIHGKMSDEDEKEILEIYQEAGEKAIRADKKVMEGLLKEGKISQEVYDEVVLKEVTVGLNMYNDLKEMEYRLKDGRLKEAKEIILPKEEKKIYKGESASGNAWIDSGEKQVILASMEEIEKEEIEKRRKGKKKEDIEVPVIYENMREIVECKGNKIYKEYVEKIKKVEGAVFRKEQQVLQDCDNYDQIAERYEIDPEKMEVSLSRDGDWYVIGEERENEYYIPDMAMVGGTNSQRNEKIETDTKAATFELAYVMYKKLIEMGEKQKTVRYEATKDTSYINTKRMEEKGLVEILSEENDTFENSDIEMKNVVVRPNVEKLKEEIKKVEKMLKILEERGYQKTKIDLDSSLER